MASKPQVRQYLAYWFQLGKKISLHNGEETLLPQPVLENDHYSQEFEKCWQKIIAPDAGDCYLEGTEETIAELLTPAWELILCARCPMPIPVRTKGMPASTCPCHDLMNWPNNELPPPRLPVNTQKQLNAIRHRLLQASQRDAERDSPDPSNNSPSTAVELPLNLPLCDCQGHSNYPLESAL